MSVCARNNWETEFGIRKIYRKGNGQGSRFRGRMNAWPFYRLRKFIEYKAGWEGL